MAFLENLHLQIDLINKNVFNKQIGLPQIAEVVQEIVRKIEIITNPRITGLTLEINHIQMTDPKIGIWLGIENKRIEEVFLDMLQNLQKKTDIKLTKTVVKSAIHLATQKICCPNIKFINS